MSTPTQTGQGFYNDFQNSGNIFDQSAAGFGGGMNSAFQGLNFTPTMGQAGSAGAQGYNAQNIDGTEGYQGSMVNAPTDYTAGQLLNTDLGNYMNPYTQNVIDQSMSSMNDARMMTGNSLDAAIGQAGAFGGSRHGIQGATNDSNFVRDSGNLANQMNMQNYQQAQGMAMGDIGMRNQAGMFNNQMDMQGQLANQGSENAASQFNLTQEMQQQLANQNAQNQAAQFGANAGNMAGLQNSQNATQMAMANLQAQLTGNQQNMQSGVNLANMSQMGLNMGQSVNQGLANNGAQQQELIQNIINAGQGQFEGFTGAPGAQADLLAQLMGNGEGSSGQSTTQNNAGLMDWLGMGSQLWGNYNDWQNS